MHGRLQSLIPDGSLSDFELVEYESDFDESDVEIVLYGEEGAELSESEGCNDSELDNSAPSGESETEDVE